MSITENFSKKLKGESRFVTDILPDNPIFGFTVRATIPRGEILSIRLPELPPGYLAARSADIPGKKYITIFKKQIPILAEKKISYLGEPILLLAGPRRSLLKRLAAEIKIEYREKQPVLSLDEVKTNNLRDNLKFSRGDTATAFAAAEKIITTEYRTHLQIPYNIEPECTIAIYNNYQTIIYVASQYPFNIRNNLAEILNIHKNKLRVIIPDMCSLFGGKLITPPLIAAHAGLLAYLTQKAVKIEYSQNEDLSFGVKRHPFRINCRSALDKEHQLSALEFEIQVDMGYYDVLAKDIAWRMITAAANYYKCDNIRVDIVVNQTNKPPMGGFTGIGEEIFCFVMERHSQQIATYLQQDPLTWKTENLPPAKKKHQPPAALAVLEQVVAISDFKRKYGAYTAVADRKLEIFAAGIPIRGIGLALCPHHIAVGYEQTNTAYRVEAVFGKDRKLRIKTSMIDIADSKATLFAMTASRLLNIHVSEVILEQVDTSKVPDSGATTSSKAVSILNKLVDQCCRSIQRKLKKESLPLMVQKKYSIPKEIDIIDTTWEATVVEVEIDPITYEIQCRGIWSVVDAGEVINTDIARNHLEAAALMNYEAACSEIKDSEHLINHIVAGSIDNPPMSIQFLTWEKPLPTPKSLGDQPICGVAPAYANAISQACGMEFNRLPVTPEIIQSFRKNNVN